MDLESTLVGVAGEYLAAGELTLRGYVASITLRNSRGIDIVASSSNGTRSANFQIKTNKSGASSWILNKASEEFFAPNHYYIFVSLRGLTTRPGYYVVPSKVVATYTKETHLRWLAGRKKDGGPRRDSTIRKFADPAGEFLENWDVIDL